MYDIIIWLKKKMKKNKKNILNNVRGKKTVRFSPLVKLGVSQPVEELAVIRTARGR